MEWFRDLFGGDHHMSPHGYCLFWEPGLIWTHALSDTLIAAAYFSIPVMLVQIVRKRGDVQFSWIFWLFALFITACGTTHLIKVYNLWNAAYGLEGGIKVITAIASVGTAIVLKPMIPKILAIPSPLLLAEKNRELEIALEKVRFEAGERLKAEEALRQAQKMEAVGQLTGGIAHDFNNLLQVITGSMALISAGPDSPKVRKWARMGQEAAERGTKLTSQLLAFSRVQKLELRPLDPNPLVLGMQVLLQSTLGPSYRLEFDLGEPGRERHIMSDPTQIELAVMNLVINARDAMPDGGRIQVVTRYVDHPGDEEIASGAYLCICVEDEGIGMDEEVAARAFDPFFTTKGVGKGTGLGLSMVYGVAKQSGGRAELSSEAGKGTRVCMMLPVVDVDETQQEGISADPEAVTADILLVDDDDDVREMAGAMLEAQGHSVRAAQNAIEALTQIAERAPELVILDYAMPGMTGAELAREIKANGFDIPVLFATGYADTDKLKAAVGNAAIIYKPFTPRELQKAIAARLAQD
jgi:signal transduction histidine kinase/CheY-like chemotaxis protein